MSHRKGTPPANPFPKGAANKGKPKGATAHTTRVLKEAILLAAEAVGEDKKGKDGLEGYLRMVARTDVKSFCVLLGKVLPMQITGAEGGPIVTATIKPEELTPEQLRAIASIPLNVG